MQKAEDVGNPQHPELKKYLADPLLTRVRLAIRDAKENGAMRTGSLGSDPSVTAVTLDSVPAAVEIQDCIDSSKYKLVYRDTKKSVPGTVNGRFLATAGGKHGDAGHQKQLLHDSSSPVGSGRV